jgi:tetratricopeptide (TPR) repeat protein
LGESYRMAGDNYKAISTFQQASELMSSLGRDETQSAAVMFNDWALAFEAVGQSLKAEKLFRRAIEISRTGETEDSVAPMLLNNYALTLRELARLHEAADYAERAYSKARRAGSQAVTYYVLYNRAMIYLEQHDYGRAAAMIGELEPILRARFSAGNHWFANLASAQSLLVAGRGNLQPALTLADKAVSILETDQQPADLLPIMLIRRSSIALLAGQFPRAQVDAARALTVMQSAAPPGTRSADLGHAYLNLGLALRAQDLSDQARDAFRDAAVNLQPTLGFTHPDTRRARHLAGLEATR